MSANQDQKKSISGEFVGLEEAIRLLSEPNLKQVQQGAISLHWVVDPLDGLEKVVVQGGNGEFAVLN